MIRRIQKLIIKVASSKKNKITQFPLGKYIYQSIKAI